MANQTKILGRTISIGDTVKISHKVKEKDKERIQVYTGVVIAFKGKGLNKSFTVRRIASGVGVERIWPVEAPVLTKIEVKQKGHARRAKLYYLRNRVGKEAVKVNLATNKINEQTESGSTGRKISPPVSK